MSSYTGDGDGSWVQGKIVNRSHLHLVFLHVGGGHGIGLHSTIDQHPLPSPVDYGIAHIQWP